MTTLRGLTSIQVEVTGARGQLGIDLQGAPTPGQFLVSAPGGGRKFLTATGTGADAGLRTDLAGNTGSGFVGWLRSTVGALRRSLSDWMSERVSLGDFATTMDGVTDNTAALLAACNTFGPKGGLVDIPWGAKVLLDSDFAAPAKVGIRGPHRYAGRPGGNTAVDYAALGGSLILNASATRTLGAGSSISGLFIYRKGMTFPATDASAYAGTAFTAAGDDVTIAHSHILGFNLLYSSSGYQRPRFESIEWDCTNGFDISNCLDVPYFNKVHGWPFGTIQANAPWQSLVRSGTAYYLHGTVDHAKMTDVFGFGYNVTFHLKDVNSAILSSCGGDNLFDSTAGGPLNAGSKGFIFEGDCSGIRTYGLQASAMDAAGVEVKLNDGKFVDLDGAIWASGANGAGVVVTSGDVNVGVELRSHSTGVRVDNATSKVKLLSKARIDTVTQIVYATVQTTNVTIDKPHFAASIPPGQQVVVGAVSVPIIASADPLPLPMNGDMFIVSGGNSFGNMSGGYKGRRGTLRFQQTLNMFASSNNINSMYLRGYSQHTTSANDIVEFIHDGNQFWQVSS